MKGIRWQIAAGAALLALSALFYFIHYLVFKDAHHIFSYLLTDLAFVPIEVLLVTMIIHQLLTMREKRERLEKLNMVIGVFFSEAGTELLATLSGFDRNIDRIRKDLLLSADETPRGFTGAMRRISAYRYDIEMSPADIEGLRAVLLSKRDFLIRLLENPVLLEHESFTDLLLAVFHLIEELAHRKDVARVTEPDLAHLHGDIERAYSELISEWLSYMEHLKENYPYLFSLALRTNPFDRDASAELR